MSTRKPANRSRAVRPCAEPLEHRRVLSSVLGNQPPINPATTISGRDIDGDLWTIRLAGPGSVRVVKQPGADGNPAPLDSNTLIESITVAGTDPVTSKLLGRVTKSPTGDGRVYFANLTSLSDRSEQLGGGNGLVAVDMPNFWLGDTAPSTPSVAGVPKATINIPDGVVTLRLGGADTTAFFGTSANQRLNQNNVSDQFAINLGLPQYGGTRIILDRVITDAQPSTSTGTTPGNPTQDGVTFTVLGRLELFQANSIEGDPEFPSGRFINGGGTLVQSIVDPFSGVPGQIGNFRVGFNARNLSVQTNDRISNFFIGGETDNVNVLAPVGLRNTVFGLGMDNVTINAGTMETLSANRGAVNATVISDEAIGRAHFGGDVISSQILAGYVQDLPSVFQQQQLGTEPTAQSSANMQVLVAGDVVDTVFAAGAQPFNGVFGTPYDITLPHGFINAKVEGVIDNAAATPEMPETAFYAQTVRLVRGPVIPPAVPQAPYPRPAEPVGLPGILDITRVARVHGIVNGASSGPFGNARAVAANSRRR